MGTSTLIPPSEKKKKISLNPFKIYQQQRRRIVDWANLWMEGALPKLRSAWEWKSPVGFPLWQHPTAGSIQHLTQTPLSSVPRLWREASISIWGSHEGPFCFRTVMNKSTTSSIPYPLTLPQIKNINAAIRLVVKPKNINVKCARLNFTKKLIC